MHALHRVLVYIPDVATNKDQYVKDTLKEAIRKYAVSQTEEYCMQAFDWRETDSAGGWKTEYPEQIYLASDDPQWFKTELERVKKQHEDEIWHHLSALSKNGGKDNLNWVLGENVANTADAYHLLKLGELVFGRYIFDSLFYDAHDDCGRITNSDIAAVMEEPENWALVMFDYHY